MDIGRGKGGEEYGQSQAVVMEDGKEGCAGN